MHSTTSRSEYPRRSPVESKPGKVNREALFSLRRIEIDDDRWRNAVQAINDSIQVVGSKSYVRIYQRKTVEDKWEAISIDMASL